MYNYNASTEIEVNALAAEGPDHGHGRADQGPRGQIPHGEQVPLAYLPYNALYDDNGQIVSASPPQRMQPPTPPTAFIQAKIGADQDMKATMGQWGPALGEPSGEKSGKAISARQRESDVGTFHYTDNLARALRYAGTIALDMLPEIIDSSARSCASSARTASPITSSSIRTSPTSVQGRGRAGRQEDEDLQLLARQIRGGREHRPVVHHPPGGGRRVPDDRGAVGQGPGDGERADVPGDEESGLERGRRGDDAAEDAPAAAGPRRWRRRRRCAGTAPARGRAMVTQLKQAVGQAHGQLDAAKQALRSATPR
jgi:hypothetical protein